MLIKESSDDSGNGLMGPFTKAARWIPLGIDPFLDLADVLIVGTTVSDDTEDSP
jgi:hypothetical protein